MSNQFRPMLAAKAEIDKLKFPVLASPKLDGVRALIKDGVVLSRSLKPIPNKRIQLLFGRPEYNGLDGELIVGNPYSATVYNDTIREVMTIDGPCTADLYVFDRHDMPNDAFHDRIKTLISRERIYKLPQKLINNADELLQYEAEVLAMGYEGLILRSLDGKYKYGRSTLKEGGMLKLKRFEDAEAYIIGMEELMHNANEAQTNELGLTKRQTLQENQVPMGMMGALIVKDCASGVEFKIGTGFDEKTRRWFWDQHMLGNDYAFEGKGGIIKYKSFKIGEKDKPRHPVYLGMRYAEDM